MPFPHQRPARSPAHGQGTLLPVPTRSLMKLHPTLPQMTSPQFGRSSHLNSLELIYYKYYMSPYYVPGTGHSSWGPSRMRLTHSCPLPVHGSGGETDVNEQTHQFAEKYKPQYVL